MAKSRKSKILALALCAGIMSGIYANPALAYDVWNNDTLGYQEGTTTTTTGTTLKNPEIHHQEKGVEIPGGYFDRPVHENGDEACGESADRITIGDINKVKNDLVDNDKQNAEAIDNLETKVDGINEAIESGALKGEQGEKGEDGKDGVDGKDGASIASGEYNVQDGTGIVQMPIEDEDGNKVGDVQINNIASQNDLKDETVARENADKELADKIGQEEMNRVNEDAAIRGEIGNLGAVVGDLNPDDLKDAYTQAGTQYIDPEKSMVEADIALDKALQDHQQQLDEHGSQMDEIRGDVGGLIANDAVQDATLAGHTNQIASMGQELNAQKEKLETVDTDKHVAADNYEIDKTNDTITMPIVKKQYQYDENGNVIGFEYVESGESIVLKDVASAAELDVVQDKTQHITADDTTTTIDSDLDVNGEITADGVLVASEDSYTNIASGKIELEDADGNYTGIYTNGMYVEDADGNVTDIYSDGMYVEDGDDNYSAYRADGMTVEDAAGNETTIAADGMTVESDNGTTNVTTNDVIITKPGADGYNIKLSDMGQVSNIDSELTQNSNYDNTVVGAVNAEADIRRSEVARLDNRIDDLDDRIGKVGAMSAAIANLHTMGYDPAAPTEIAVGVGQYRDDTGMALGLFHYPNRDFMLSLSVSTAGDEFMGGIGATWKLGRKSPEKVAAIKQAQAEADMRRAEADKLAKAEAMQKAAKEAKVRAQMERHAKMAAEQAAAAE